MKRSILVIVLVLVAIAALAAMGIIPRMHRQAKADQITKSEADRVPGVHVVAVGQVKDTLGLALPARIEAFRTTDLFARAQGYVTKWTADIGQTVQQGQVLAHISQPEIEQDIISARTNLDLARVNLERLQSVTLPGAISKAELDDARAKAKAAEAQYRRALDLQSFQDIKAPFSGVVTARNIEVGAYVTPGSQTPLYSLNNDQTLRVFVDVPQSEVEAAQVGEGMATLTVPELPGRKINAEIVRNAGAFDEQSRTLTVQLQVPAGHGLLPGMYGSVTFQPKALPAGQSAMSIPANTMYYSNKGPAVLVVNKEKKIEFRPITIDKDFGTYVIVASGIKHGEEMVVNPSSRLLEGMTVNVLPPEKEEPKKPGGGH